MGIKFLCPHGHKLNVKTFLAGKKGVCPECGERFVIPLESQPKQRVASIGVSNALQAGVQGAIDSLPEQVSAESAYAAHEQAAVAVAAPVGAGALNAAGASAGWGERPAVPAQAAPQVSPGVPVGTPAISPTSISPTSISPTSISAPDPLSEAPQATWYVRPPSGGQFGPAKSDLLRRWIAEGRVSADSLVWREDWPDWRTAGGLLPGVGEVPAPSPTVPAAPSLAVGTPLANRQAGSISAPIGNVSSPTGYVAPAAMSPASMQAAVAPTALGGPLPAPAGMASAAATAARPGAARRPRSQYGLLIVIMLALIAVLMLVALVYVIKSN